LRASRLGKHGQSTSVNIKYLAEISITTKDAICAEFFQICLSLVEQASVLIHGLIERTFMCLEDLAVEAR